MMNFMSVGDLAGTFQARRHSVDLKTDLSRLAQELATGQKSGLSTLSGGDFQPLVDLERSLRSNASYTVSTSEAALFSSTMQTSLELVQSVSSDLSSALLLAGTADSPMLVQTTTADARTKFETIISAFNTRVADRYAFSGASTDRPALADAGTILADLQAATASETSAIGFEAAVDAWFDTIGGGFETVAYIGSNNGLAPFRLSRNETTDLDLTAADPDVRTILKGFAMAALVGGGALTADSSERARLTRRAGEMLLNSNATVTTIRSRIGSSEAVVEAASARNIAEKSTLEIARNTLIAIDPFRAATELEAVRTQLETLYKVTVRMSALSLSEYMR